MESYPDCAPLCGDSAGQSKDRTQKFAVMASCGVFAVAVIVVITLVHWRVVPAIAKPVVTRVLFIGNSFTYKNDLPHQFAQVSNSHGKAVEVANFTIPGCNLYSDRPSKSARVKELLDQDWDFVVLQDFSMMPILENARSRYLFPALKDFAKAVEGKKTKLVFYMTWAYHEGSPHACPSSMNPKCVEERGNLANLTDPPCESDTSFKDMVASFDCMAYALTRGVLSTSILDFVDMVAPAGLAWQIMRSSTSNLTHCKQVIDRQYSSKEPKAPEISFSSFAEDHDKPKLELNIYKKWDEQEPWDKHPNVAGQYLNALTFFRTIFGISAINSDAPQPECTTHCVPNKVQERHSYKGLVGPIRLQLNRNEAHALQKAADDAVRLCGAACGVTPEFVV